MIPHKTLTANVTVSFDTFRTLLSIDWVPFAVMVVARIIVTTTAGKIVPDVRLPPSA
ncbi:MAG: hypothetical protein AABZ80_10610 [Gemmatimonadota bacterium]